MKVFNTKEIREVDDYTIKYEPVSSVDLMERAANNCVSWIIQNFSLHTSFVIFTGPGNNGGDGWAIARILTDKGFFAVKLFHLEITPVISSDSETNRTRLINQGKVEITTIRSASDFPCIEKKDVVIDALFGSGLSRPLVGLAADMVKHINLSGNKIISIDMPSGMLGEDNSENPESGIIKADITLTFQFPKCAFFYAENEKHTGQWHIIPIGIHPSIIEDKPTSFYYTTIEDICKKIKKRSIFSHKGNYGHALLIAGSYGMMGAAILSAKACLRSGTGLLTTHIPQSCYAIIQGSVPESIFSIDKHYKYFSQLPDPEKYTAIGIGPGIGMNSKTAVALKTLLKSAKFPLLLDADAINILSANPGMVDLLPENTIITPHPLEFDRLAGISATGFERNKLQIQFSKKHKIIIVLKGAFSSVTLPDGSCFFNSTGNPGMATAGSGDVLTGIVLSLLSQKYQPDEAAIIGTFLHGLSGDIAAFECSQQSLIASDIVNNIGNAYKKINQYERPEP